MKNQIFKTDDDSLSVFNSAMNESYHSKFGAITESQSVFIKNGFLTLKKPCERINILEFGFGTGLNVLLTFNEVKNKQIFYKSLELFPLSLDIVISLQYTSDESYRHLESVFLEIHRAAWNSDIAIGNHFILHKSLTDFNDFQTEASFYDLIYFDAFSPETQPALWSEVIFKKLFESLKPEGILVTYSSKGIVKKVLRDAGFLVERLKGPPGKRHVLRALKPSYM
ncbi:MAG: tRNA (5-methylaminomethyl-2-thiouridine)(34)-methyltransferase MnmD [Bacteroidales bacterium]|nr:tRNA (5-methylaminomethyl-2-thiouridine)(34)-methyltransferase MnmD [Bacteroidales bacterium]